MAEVVVHHSLGATSWQQQLQPHVQQQQQQQQQQLQPLGVGLAGAPPAARARDPTAAASPGGGARRAAWSAGPGGRSPAGGASPRMVVTSGVRYKQLAAFEGAADAVLQQASRDTMRVDKSIKDMAGPYQKDAAVRGAAGALRPWSPYAGLGERRGAKFGDMFARVSSFATHGQDPAGAPSLFAPPAAGYAAAVAAVAGRVARPGTAQMRAPGAWSPVPGQPARELWPQDLQDPPKYCAGCRGGHLPEKERNPSWEPYTPRMRLENLNVLASRFQAALVKGQLCMALNDGSHVAPLRWTWRVKDSEGDEVEVNPRKMSQHDFTTQLALMFDGLREGHEPYRHQATLAVQAFLDTHSPHLPSAVPGLITPLRLALQTYEPSLVGHALLMLQRLLRSHPLVGSALVAHLRHLLPPMALFRKKRFVVHLPPPFCVGAAGSFTGSGCAPEQGARKCSVCGCPLDKEHSSKAARQKAHAAALDNPHLLEKDLPGTYSRHPLQGRKSNKYVLCDLITNTLDVIMATCGQTALPHITASFPTYSYYDPK